MKKRNVFDELVQGFDDLKAEREGKITLKSTTVEVPQPITISAGQITALRERLNYSQGVFAALLRTNVSTLRNWEQDRAKPNAQAALLLKLVESAPEEILGKISALGETRP
ncbi:helix-turn-helix domain-containing protein [Haliea sp.]